MAPVKAASAALSLDTPTVSTKQIRSVKTEAKTTRVVDVARYVHDDPRDFKGRLGYACLNTVLRHQKPPVFCSRTCRTAQKNGVEYLQELALQNIKDLKKLIQWNEDNHIKFMRISSEVFPLATHEKVGYSIDFAKDALAETTHPGQYNQLVSLTPKVVENTIRDLSHHAQMMDYMGLDQDGVMIIHMGGVYGDKESAIARFEEQYVKLPEPVKRRLVLENDEFGYSVSDLLPVCKKLKIPIVLDWHHHYINPGDIKDLVSVLPEINQIWAERGIKPKTLPPTTDDVDLMIEAKDKEQAVLELYKLFDLQPVNDESYIPIKGTELTQTKGRKSNKKGAKKIEEETTDVVEAIVEETVERPVTEELSSTRKSKRKAIAAMSTVLDGIDDEAMVIKAIKKRSKSVATSVANGNLITEETVKAMEADNETKVKKGKKEKKKKHNKK
ncbi:hypothetical protein RMCBS344292_15344 [Rhizopus microsporus]|nr:hypothetical protein RMCBS344292_15344 [Rhizopus microsporus]